MKMFLNSSSKYGPQTVLVDDEDAYLLENYGWYLHSSDRHHGIYVIFYRAKANKELSEKRLHRVILQASADQIVDHINGNPLDNRRANLRLTTQAKNNLNARKVQKGSSRFKGVCLHKDGGYVRWKAQIQFNKNKICLGYFLNEDDAARAYDAKAKELFGEFAKLNFPEENI